MTRELPFREIEDKGLREIVRRATEKKRENRYQSAESMLADLTRLSEGRGISASGTRQVVSTSGGNRKDTPGESSPKIPYGWFYAGAVAVGLAAGVVLNLFI